jgi:hypothetical protein
LTAYVDFNFQVVEHGLGHLPFTEKQVVTPTGVFTGSIFFNSFKQYAASSSSSFFTWLIH